MRVKTVKRICDVVGVLLVAAAGFWIGFATEGTERISPGRLAVLGGIAVYLVVSQWVFRRLADRERGRSRRAS